MCVLRATLSLLVAAAAAQAPSWLGLRPSPNAPGSVDLIDLADNAKINRVIGTLALGRDEVPFADAARCLPGPPAFCLFATQDMGPTPSPGNESFIYRIDAETAALVWKSTCPGTCAHMHVDYSSTRAFTFSFEGPGGARAEVLDVPASGGPSQQLADVSTAVAGGNVLPGQTTHCSATNHMYIGVSHGGAGKDQVRPRGRSRCSSAACCASRAPTPPPLPPPPRAPGARGRPRHGRRGQGDDALCAPV